MSEYLEGSEDNTQHEKYYSALQRQRDDIYARAQGLNIDFPDNTVNLAQAIF